jgi:hypothetical protein
MRVTRLIAGLGVGGIVTFGAVAPASAGGAPILTIGHGTSGAVVNVLPIHEYIPPKTVTVSSLGELVTGVQVFGKAPSSDGSLSNALADPLPLTICALCKTPHSESPS